MSGGECVWKFMKMESKVQHLQVFPLTVGGRYLGYKKDSFSLTWRFDATRSVKKIQFSCALHFIYGILDYAINFER